MRFFKKPDVLISLLIVIGVIFIFKDIFLNGKILFPSNFLAHIYSPWTTERIKGWEQGIPNKPIGDDQIRIFYPSRVLTNQLINKGVLPLWNPHIFSGTPHLADFQSAVFYPLNFLYVFLPQMAVWNLLLLIQPIMATVFMYLFLRSFKLHQLAIWLGAISFGFSGFMLVWSQENVVVGQAALWLPLGLWGIENFLTTNKRIYYLLTVLALTFSLLAGFFQVTFYIFALTLLYSLFRIFSIKDIKKIKAALLITSIYFFSFCLSAVQLIPSMEAFFLSPRNIVSAWYLFETYLLPVTHIFNAIAPDIFGNPAVYNFFGRGFYRETILYAGVIPFIFATYTIFKMQKNGVTRFFIFSSIITFFLAINSPVTKWLFSLPLPFLPTFLPSRILILTSFSLSVLSALGFSSWLESKKVIDRKFLYAILTTFLLLLLISFYALISLFNFDHFDPSNILSKINFEYLNTYMIRQGSTPTRVDIMVILRNLAVPFGMLFLLGVLSIFKKRYISLLLIVIFTLLGQLLFLNKYSVIGEPQFLYPQHPTLSFLQSKNSLERFLSLGQPIHENTSIITQTFSVEGVNPIFPSRYGQLLYAILNKGKVTNNIPRVEARLSELDSNENPFRNAKRLRLFSLLGIKHILYFSSSKPTSDLVPPSTFKLVWNHTNWYGFEYKNTLPRAFFAKNIYIEKDPQKIVDLIFNPKLDLSQDIILEEKPSELTDSDKRIINLSSSDKNSFVKIKDYEPERIKILVKTNVPQILFISDNYYPGWKAYVDNKETKIYRANYTFRGIYIPAGEYVIKYTYEPISIKIGLIVSLLSLFLYIFIIVFPRFKHKKLNT